MKLPSRFDSFKTCVDETSAYLREFRFDIDYFAHWPQQARKTLTNISSSHIKLIIQKSGQGDVTVQDARYPLTPGSMMIIPPYTVCSGNSYDGGDAYDLFFSVHPVTREQEFLHRLGFDHPQLFPDLLSGADFNFLALCYQAMQSREEGSYAQLQALLMLLLIRACRAHGLAPSSGPTGNREQALIGKYFAYLNEHIHEPVQIAQVCSALQVSQSYLYRCCKNVMGCSSNTLITRHKLTHACRLLRNPDLTVGEVAEAVGYDPYYFSNQFRKLFLVSPSEYRKSFK